MYSVIFHVVGTTLIQLDTIPAAESKVLQLFAVGREDRAATLAALSRFRFVFHHTVIYLCGSEKGSGLLQSLQLGHHHDSGVVLLRAQMRAFYHAGRRFTLRERKDGWLRRPRTQRRTV
jgi:hypothetical protein